MPQVPYSPIPEVEPISRGTPTASVATPPAAFGANVGEAIQGLGKAAEGVGNELFVRAVALQQVHNEAEKDNLVSASIRASGDLDNKFRLLAGSDPQDKLQDHIKALSDSREGFSSAASNPVVKKGFDSDTMRRYSYDVINAGNYAATELKKFSRQSLIASEDAKIDKMVADPYNVQLREETIKGLIDTQGSQNREDGLRGPLADERMYKRIGGAIAKVSGALANTDPDAAEDLVTAYKGKVPESIYAPALEAVRKKGIDVRATMAGQIIGSDQGAIANVPGSFIQGIKQSEGFAPTAKWDYKQDTNGYGTKALYPGERIDKATAQARFEAEITHAASIVDKVSPNLDQGTRAALISLTFNAGDKWVTSGLGDKVRAGDIEGAKASFLQYIKAGGADNAALTARRLREAQWFGQGATGVGPQGVVSTAQRIENLADQYYDKNTDPVSHAEFMVKAEAAVSRQAAFQQKQLTMEKLQLQNQVQTVLNTVNPTTQRAPISDADSRKVDPNFDANLTRLLEINPQYRHTLDQAYTANSNHDNPDDLPRKMEFERWRGSEMQDRMNYDANAAFNQGKITNKDRQAIIHEQGTTKRLAEDDNRADLILNRHRFATDAIKAWPSRRSGESANNARYEQIRGALIMELKKAEAGGVPVRKPEEEDKIISNLINNNISTGEQHWYGGEIKKPLYQIEGDEYRNHNLPPITVGSVEEAKALPAGRQYILNGALATRSRPKQ
jgi:GH24 family phage-related lysozyme (muramidase)